MKSLEFQATEGLLECLDHLAKQEKCSRNALIEALLWRSGKVRLVATELGVERQERPRRGAPKRKAS